MALSHAAAIVSRLYIFCVCFFLAIAPDWIHCHGVLKFSPAASLPSSVSAPFTVFRGGFAALFYSEIFLSAFQK